MIITKNGIAIRMNVSDLRVMGRATQGVRLINIQDNDSIAAITKVDHEDEPEIETSTDVPTSEIPSSESSESENNTQVDDTK